MLPTSLKDYPGAAKPYVIEKRFFIAYFLNPEKLRANQPSKVTARKILDLIVDPIISESESVFLYPDLAGNPDNEFLSGCEGFLEARRKHYIVTSRDRLTHPSNLEFWRDRDWKRGSIAAVVQFNKDLFKQAFQHCYDAGVLNNPAAISGQSVINFARRHVEQQERNVYVVIPPGLKQAFFFRRREDVFQLYKLAADNCRYSDRLITWFGRADG